MSRSKRVFNHELGRAEARDEQQKSMRLVTRKTRGGGSAGARRMARPLLTVRAAQSEQARQGQSPHDKINVYKNSDVTVRRACSAAPGSRDRKLLMNSPTDDDAPVEVVISRSSIRRCWMILMGGHAAPLPWADSADASAVASWVKANASGKVTVQIRL